MKVFCLPLLIALPCSFLQAQPQPGKKLEEVRDTLRFVRLAETRKNLSFDDETLLRVNEVLDAVEDRRFALIIREQRVKQRVRQGNLSDEEADTLLDEMIAIRKGIAENETEMWSQIRSLLTPSQAIEFFAFYGKFTREIQRRIRMLQGEDPGNNPRHRRFRGGRNLPR